MSCHRSPRRFTSSRIRARRRAPPRLRPEERLGLLVGQRLLARGAAQVRLEHVGVRRVDHGGLGRQVEQLVGMLRQVLVERVVLRDQHGERLVARDARRGPACCHIDARVPG